MVDLQQMGVERKGFLSIKPCQYGAGPGWKYKCIVIIFNGDAQVEYEGIASFFCRS